MAYWRCPLRHRGWLENPFVGYLMDSVDEAFIWSEFKYLAARCRADHPYSPILGVISVQHVLLA